MLPVWTGLKESFESRLAWLSQSVVHTAGLSSDYYNARSRTQRR